MSGIMLASPPFLPALPDAFVEGAFGAAAGAPAFALDGIIAVVVDAGALFAVVAGLGFAAAMSVGAPIAVVPGCPLPSLQPKNDTTTIDPTAN